MAQETTKAPRSLDAFDRRILEFLQTDGRITNTELARRVNLSESACLRRVKSLETDGLIDRYVAVLDQARAGFPTDVFVEIALGSQQQEDLDAFETAVRLVPEIMECHLMSGDFDYLVRVVVRDVADYERIHSRQLTRLPYVARVRSSFSLRTITKKTQLPLSGASA